MERLRVDTDELKVRARVFERSSDVYAQAGKEILAFAASLPSYEGQLSGPARAAALEINRQCQELHAAEKEDADTLDRIAKAFEDADNQAIAGFARNQEVVADTPIGKYFLTCGFGNTRQVDLYDKPGDGGPGRETGFYQPFHDFDADINGTVGGTLTFLPDGASDVEDDGEAPENWWDAFASFLQGFVNWLDDITGSKKTREKAIGETVEFYVEYSRDSKGIGGFKINGVSVRNNSSEPIRIDFVYIEVNGVQYKAKIVGAPVFIQPGDAVNMQIIQETPIIPYYLGATVTLRGSRPYSNNSEENDLITLTIPPINQPMDVTK